MAIIIKIPKIIRNPLVIISRKRKAGPHKNPKDKRKNNPNKQDWQKE
jgi:hypothetical protein